MTPEQVSNLKQWPKKKKRKKIPLAEENPSPKQWQGKAPL